MSRYTDPIWLYENVQEQAPQFAEKLKNLILVAPSVDIVRCRECKHRPIKEDANGENYGFNLIKPTEGDERCPCLVDDGWYSWMPEDDFYCGYGERRRRQ